VLIQIILVIPKGLFAPTLPTHKPAHEIAALSSNPIGCSQPFKYQKGKGYHKGSLFLFCEPQRTEIEPVFGGFEENGINKKFTYLIKLI
jgi:hypothetical protein